MRWIGVQRTLMWRTRVPMLNPLMAVDAIQRDARGQSLSEAAALSEE